MSQTAATLALQMDRISLSVPADPTFHGTLRLVVGGIASRLQLPYEQVNELQLAVEALVSHRTTIGPTLSVDADLDGESVSITVGPFTPDPDLEGHRVVERLVQRARVVHREDGAEWIELSVAGPGGEQQW